MLEVFHKLCQDGQTIVELFINYDCGMGIVEDELSTEQGLFERITGVICSMAKTFRNAEMDKNEIAVRKKLYMLALKVL